MDEDRPDRSRYAFLFAFAFAFAVLFVSPGSAPGQVPCENEDGYRSHRTWRGSGAYASTVNLLQEGTSFETGEPDVSLLDGALYNQRQFVENLTGEGDAADAYLDLSADDTDAVHGNRSLRIDFDGPYPTGGPSGWFELSWEWFGVPEEAYYDISFYAKTNRQMNVLVNLIALDTVTSEVVWIDLDTASSVVHKTLPVSPGGWRRLSVRTPTPLSTTRSYVIRLWTNGASEPSWCVTEGTVLRLDAIQVARAPDGGGALVPYEYHTEAEELFLSVKGALDLLPRWDNVFYAPGEGGSIRGRAQIYQDAAYAARGGGTLHWKLYALFPQGGDPSIPVGSGDAAITFPSPRQEVTVDLASAVGGRLGVYKWIAEFEDGLGLTSDRQEITFALVRGDGASGDNFGVNLNALGPAGKNANDSYSPSVSGPFSLRRMLDLTSRLGFTQDRVFAAFDWGTTMEDPSTPERYDFYPDLAASYSVRIFPVISSVPSWWNGSDWQAWRDFIDEEVFRYGPGGLYGAGMTEWNLFNEMFAPGRFTPGEYAPFLLEAADAIHGTTPAGETYVSLNGWSMPDSLVALLNVGDGSRRVLDILDGVGVNRYASFDPVSEEVDPPEEPSSWHAGVADAVWIQRAARLAVQLADTAGTGGANRFPLTETGATVGSLLADRRSRVRYWDQTGRESFANSMSGSLTKGEKGAERLIRHELLALAEGGGAIHLFGFLPHPESWSSGRYGIFQIDDTPAAPLAAQVELNRELGAALFVRHVPSSDLNAPGGGPNTDPDARLLLFHDPDPDEYVIAAWTAGYGTSQIELDIDPGAYNVSARDVQGNTLPVGGSGSFTWTLGASPTYIRVDGSIGAVALTEAVDHRDPSPPVWISSRTEKGTYIVRFSSLNAGDLDSLRLEYRAVADTSWTTAERFEPWAHPDSAYTGSFPVPPGGSCTARAAAIEKTTGDVVYSDELPLGPTGVVAAPAAAAPRWTDAVSEGSPNPARGSLFFQGTVAQGGKVTMRIHDVAGRLVREVVTRRSGAGSFRITWDGRDESGRPAASGLYLARFDREGHSIGRRRIILLR